MKTVSIVAIATVLCIAVVLLVTHPVYDRSGGSTLSSSGGRRTSEVQSTSQKRDFSAALTKIKYLLSLIWHRYEMYNKQGSQFFRTANNIDPFTWQLLKFNFAQKILTPNSRFLMVFGGSSVTAGHDSYYNQSYPYIFKKRMEDIFKALGVELVVHNIAQGANNCIPYTYCYEAMGGADPDFLGWEQSYNCGRDNGVFEFMARLSLWTKSPTVVYFSASGAWSPSNCPPANETVPYCAEEWTPELEQLPPWEVQVDQVETEKDMLFRFNAKNPSNNRFASAYKRDYQNVASHGFNVWEPNGECVIQKDGKNITCGGIDSVEGCTMKFMRKEASVYGQPSGKGANWHPTRAFHMLRGEAISWLYSLILFEAIFMIEQDLVNKDPTSLATEYRNKLSGLRDSPVPNPKYCSPYHCERPPVCFTDYRPHYYSPPPTNDTDYAQFKGNLSLADVVVGKTGWTYDGDEYSAWSLEFGYLDTKPLYESKTPATDGELHILLDMRFSEHNYVWICGMPKELLIKGYLEMNINMSRSELKVYTPPADTFEAMNAPEGHSGRYRVLWDQHKKKMQGTDCEEVFDLPIGHRHVLSIKGEENSKHVTRFSHLIMFS